MEIHEYPSSSGSILLIRGSTLPSWMLELTVLGIVPAVHGMPMFRSFRAFHCLLMGRCGHDAHTPCGGLMVHGFGSNFPLFLKS